MDLGEWFKPAAKTALQPFRSLCDGAYNTMIVRQQYDDPVSLSEVVALEDNALGLDERHSARLPGNEVEDPGEHKADHHEFAKCLQPVKDTLTIGSVREGSEGY